MTVYLKTIINVMLSFYLLAPAAEAETTTTYYTTYGFMKDGTWKIPMRARVGVSEKLGFRRKALRPFLAVISNSDLPKIKENLPRIQNLIENEKWVDLIKLIRSIGEISDSLDLSASEKELYKRRMQDILPKGEKETEIQIIFEGDETQKIYRLRGTDGGFAKTDGSGFAVGEISLSTKAAGRILGHKSSSGGWIKFESASDTPEGIGMVRLVPPGAGRSVISDIDDTIKVTEIPKGIPTVLWNTFFRPFKAAPCMVKKYASFGETTSFHYVSGSPWQLYEPINRFLDSEGARFPAGGFDMKSVNTSLSDLRKVAEDFAKLLFQGSKKVTFEDKVKAITTLFENFPDRRFTLIGDSGEKDPEVFATIRSLKGYGKRIEEIIIRHVSTKDEADAARFEGMTLIDPNSEKGQPCKILQK